MKKDLNDIAAIEKAISKKYGKEAIQNPNSSWDEKKEKEYLKQLKDFYIKKEENRPKKKISENFYIKERKNSVKLERDCPVCRKYSFSTRDDIYMCKFECCYVCFINYVEGREERWFSGWRPKN